MKKRFFTDILAAALVFFSFAYFFTGHAAHEWLGLAAVLAMLVHNVFNRRFWKNPLAGAGTKRRLAQKLRLAGTAVLNVALAACVIIIFVSGAMLSTEIFPFVHAADGFFVRELHTTAAAWLLVLVAFHAGLHTQFLSGSLKTLSKKLTKKISGAVPAGTKISAAAPGKSVGAGKSVSAERIAVALKAAVALALCVYGAFAFMRRLFPEKLIAEASFDPFSLDDSLPRFVADYFCLAALFFFAAFALKKFFPR